MNLIIVESPTKARTLTRFLPGQYSVEATMGHIRDLPKAALGVDVEHGFVPKYVIPPDRQKRMRELSEMAKKADEIILATDPDREGEAIAWHVVSLLADANSRYKIPLGLSSGRRQNSKFSRIVFHEITQTAILAALKNPRAIDNKLVDAQQARRVLDRLVGYKLSPLLWQKLSKRWLSAGRVQSVTVRLMVEREREIAKFEKQEHWTIEGLFKAHDNELHATLTARDGTKYEVTLIFDLFDGKYTTTFSTINNQQSANDIIGDLQAPFSVAAVDKKEIKRYPWPPFTTSSLQQEAGRRFYFSAKKTMLLAQKLYEEGFITYHRTDSVNLADKFIFQVRRFIEKEYGKAYVADRPRRYKTKSKVAQEAHEAIRPTNVGATGDKLQTEDTLNRDHLRLYELIWKRAVACQAKEAVFDSTTIVVTSGNGYRFETQGSIVKFDGYLRIIGKDAGEVVLPNVAVGDQLTLSAAIPTQRFTQPPPRYTEATLVKTLEEKDIGRPSTYAPIISTILDRQYVTKEDRKLVPTQLGNAVTDFLVQYFPGVMELPFTAKMEASLDEIANGQRQWVPVVEEFYHPFAQTLADAYERAGKVKLAEEALDEPCPKCGSQLVIRMGRYGRFVACSTFPKCDYTRQHAQKIDLKCPRCGGDIVIKRSRKGKTFYGCDNYPKCNFAAWKKEDIK